MNNETILVVGGDGFIGWPLCLRLSKENYNLIIIDNLYRRKIDTEFGLSSLTPIASIEKRINTWRKITNAKIDFINIDISKDYESLRNIIVNTKPSSIVHLAEQRSAPYSMMSASNRRFTIDNNVNGTHNLLQHFQFKLVTNSYKII